MMRDYTVTILLLAVFVLTLGATALAADGDGLPWDELEVAIGGVVLLWGGIVAGLIEIGKHVRVGGTVLLGTPQRIWAANLILGGAGVLIYELLHGTTFLSALLAAAAALLTASGIFEGIKTAASSAMGKSSVPSSHGGTG